MGSRKIPKPASRELVATFTRGVSRKVERENPRMSMATGTVVRRETSGHFPIIWTRIDADSQPSPCSAIAGLPAVGDRVVVVFTPPHAAVVLAGGSSGGGGGG
jgi:hypothetical protein